MELPLRFPTHTLLPSAEAAEVLRSLGALDVVQLEHHLPCGFLADVDVHVDEGRTCLSSRDLLVAPESHVLVAVVHSGRAAILFPREIPTRHDD